MIGRDSGLTGVGSWRRRALTLGAGLAAGLACASTASAASPDTYLSVFAGTGTPDYSAPGPATSSPLYNPHDVAVNPSNGDVYIADYNNYRVEQVTPQGTLTEFAGNGSYGTPVPGPATSSPLGGPVSGSPGVYSGPTGVAVNPINGDVYIADPANNEIEQVTPGGTLSIVAGTGTAGAPTPGPATSSDLNSPYGVATDSSGDLFIADYGNAEVEEVDTSGNLSIKAGTGTSGTPAPGPATSVDLNAPTAVAVNGGNLYIADPFSNVVEKVAAGNLTIFAGPGGADSSSAGLNFPSGVSVDSGTGDVYIAAYGNNEVDQVTPAGVLSTFAGTGTAGLPTAGLATSSKLDSPFGVAFNAGDVYIADTGNNEVDQVGPWTAPANSTAPSVSGAATQGQKLTASKGTWSNSPTGYSYQWQDCNSSGGSCANISGATGSSYTLTGSDVGNTVRVEVTASNPGGSLTKASAVTAVVTSSSTTTTTTTSSCPAATGSLTATRLGRITLGMTRAKAGKALRKHTTASGFERFCLSGGRGIFVGYPSKALLKTLTAHQRKQVSGRVVLALTSSRHYTLDRIKAGAKVSRVSKRLAHAHKFRIGATTWYVLRSGRSTGVVKVQHGTVLEVGIANHKITATKAEQRRLLRSF